MENAKRFRFQWILLCTLASILGLITFYFWPIVSGVSVTIIQAVLLSKYIGSRAWYWLITPVLFAASLLLYGLDEGLGIVGNILVLELMFFITLKSFTYMLWTIVNGFPVGIFFLISNLSDVFSKDVLLIVGVIFIPLVTWVGQSYLLSKILPPAIKGKRITNPEILDAP